MKAPLAIATSSARIPHDPHASTAAHAGHPEPQRWQRTDPDAGSGALLDREVRRIAISTGGGDAPGLNAVIRAAALAAHHRGWEVLGIRRGYQGLLEAEVDSAPGILLLTPSAVRGITHLGGTILGATSRGRPFGVERPTGSVDDDGEAVSRQIVEQFWELDLDGLIAIGGDGSLAVAHRLHQAGIPVVGVPKTIDNDLRATDLTFGFRTAVEVATDAIGRLHSTAEAHQRVMIVEVMGRHAGWIALEAGLAGGADAILIPEIPFRMERVLEKIEERDSTHRRFSIIVVAEGAFPEGGGPSFVHGTGRYGGIAESMAQEVNQRSGKETRTLVLGHIQRGGSPIAFDRLLALQLGAAAVQFVHERRFGEMVALQGDDIAGVPLGEVAGGIKRVPLDSRILATAKQLGVCLGD